MSRVVVAGDWHGDHRFAGAVLRAAAEVGVDTLWHVGDFGIGPWGRTGWGASGAPDPHGIGHRISPVAHSLGIQVLVTPGNHENYDTIDTLPLDEQGRGVLAPGVLVLQRGHRWEHGGRTIGSLGGAFSIDFASRTPGRSWWSQEEVTPADVAALGDGPLDVLITHDVPAGGEVAKAFRLPEHLERRSDAQRLLLATAVDRTRPDLVLCGHWHQRRSSVVAPATRIEVLDRERTVGNAVVLDLDTLDVVPLEVGAA